MLLDVETPLRSDGVPQVQVLGRRAGSRGRVSLGPFRQTHLESLHPGAADGGDPAPRPHRAPSTTPERSARPAQQPGADSRPLAGSSCP